MNSINPSNDLLFSNHEKDNILYNKIHQNISSNPENSPADEGQTTRSALSGDNVSISLYRKTSFSFSFSATYSRAGILKTGSDSNTFMPDAKGPVFDIGTLKHALQDLDAMVKSFEEEIDPTDPENLDPDEMLKKIIIEKLFGKALDSNDIRVDGLKYHEEKDLTMDFSLDYSGVVKWKGSVIKTAFHLEFHLEQKEIRHIDYVPFSKDLKRLDEKTVDTGRYLISFMSSTSLRIWDKLSQLSTTIWGDPHVDLSDEKGRVNGEFSDLKKSHLLTTLKLLDDTSVVIKAPDDGLIQEVHIFKGDQHIMGIGKGASLIRKMGPNRGGGQKAGKNIAKDVLVGTFGKIDRNVSTLDEYLNASDVVRAGGDGNDWFDQTGRLIWGGQKG